MRDLKIINYVCVQKFRKYIQQDKCFYGGELWIIHIAVEGNFILQFYYTHLQEKTILPHTINSLQNRIGH